MQSKGATKKLSLNTTTLRTLTGAELGDANGGFASTNWCANRTSRGLGCEGTLYGASCLQGDCYPH